MIRKTSHFPGHDAAPIIVGHPIFHLGSRPGGEPALAGPADRSGSAKAPAAVRTGTVSSGASHTCANYSTADAHDGADHVTGAYDHHHTGPVHHGDCAHDARRHNAFRTTAFRNNA